MIYPGPNIACLIKFIEQQIDHRSKIMETHLGHYGDVKEISVIVAAGIRQFGTTSAIATIFNQDHDVYVTHNSGCIREFKIKLEEKQDIQVSKNIMSCTMNDFIEGRTKSLIGRKINRIYVDGILYSDFNKIIDAYNKLPFNVPLILV